MILIALGANLAGPFGAPEDNIKAAMTALKVRGVKIVQSSRIWLTAPVPASDQPMYRNSVIAVETDKTLPELFRTLKLIERDFGRSSAERNAPRVIDLDLIAYGKTVTTTEGLSVPHPRMHRRAFVLQPLREIAPDWVHPVLKKTTSELLANLPAGQEARPLETRAA